MLQFLGHWRKFKLGSGYAAKIGTEYVGQNKDKV